jgi:hypothetical protein
VASGLIVTINARVATKEPTPVPEEVGAASRCTFVAIHARQGIQRPD